VEKDNEEGYTNGDGDAELVVTAKKMKKVRKEKLSYLENAQEDWCQRFQVLGNKILQQNILSPIPPRTIATC